MSKKHPIISVTGSSGAGTSTVKGTFDQIFRREGVKAVSIDQYWALTCAMRSRSLATTRRVATDCTRPADSRGATFFHSTGLTS